MREVLFMFKRIFSIIICALMVSLSSVGAGALTEEDVSAPSAVLMDAGTGKFLYEKYPHDQRPCASITKVMTLILVMEALDSGRIHMDDTVTASAHAASMGGSDIWLEQGEQMSVDDMIKATVVASANDAAVALAEFVSGSEEDFVAAMNEKAAELGMNDTVFKNCNGLDEQGHITSAYDVALMSRELITHEQIFDYSSIWLDYLRNGETQIVNTNKLLRSYDGITGLKTGTTGDAGSCISATAERDGLSLIAVVLGADSGKERFRDAASLLDYGFANFESRKLSLTDSLDPISVEGGMEDSVELYCGESAVLTVPKGRGEGTEQMIDLPESIAAPINKGDKVGTLSFIHDGEVIAEFNITAESDVEEKSFSSVLSVLWNSLIKL